MKVALEIKNTGKALKPTKNNVILYDGNIWYITTKEDILKEDKELFDQCKNELENLKKENSDFKTSVATQLLEMSELIKKLYSK